MNTYRNPVELFKNVIEHNEESIEKSKEYQISTNNYYIVIADPKDLVTQSIIKYMINETGIETNEWTDVIENIKLDFDREQILNINIYEYGLKELEKEFTKIEYCCKESDGNLILIIDINLIIKMIYLCDIKDEEIHIYDFLINKLYKKLNIVHILDSVDMLHVKNRGFIYDTIMFKQLKKLLITETEEDRPNNKIFNIYSKIGKHYWNFETIKDVVEDLEDHDIFYDEKEFKNIIDQQFKLSKTDPEPDPDADYDYDNYAIKIVNGFQCVVTKDTLDNLTMNNLFDNCNNVLHPLHKLKSYR